MTLLKQTNRTGHPPKNAARVVNSQKKVKNFTAAPVHSHLAVAHFTKGASRAFSRSNPTGVRSGLTGNPGRRSKPKPPSGQHG